MDASFWNDRYAGSHHFYGEEPNDFVTQCSGQFPHGPVLCLAEGECRNAAYLATLGRRVTAIDQSEVGLDFLIDRELERDVREGNGHTGRGAVVQILARRR